MNSVQKSEHEKNLEHSKKRSRPSLLRPVSAPAKVTISCAHRYPPTQTPSNLALPADDLGSDGRGSKPQARGMRGVWTLDSLEFTSRGTLGGRLTSKVAVHPLPVAHRIVMRSVTSSCGNRRYCQVHSMVALSWAGPPCAVVQVGHCTRSTVEG